MHRDTSRPQRARESDPTPGIAAARDPRCTRGPTVERTPQGAARSRRLHPTIRAAPRWATLATEMPRKPPAAAPRRSRSTKAPEPTPSDAGAALTRRVGERLHAIRRGRGYSLDELADLTGVSKGTLSQIETGGTNP